jgi:hypothetical protein
MPIDPNSISWDSSPKVAGPKPASVAWDDSPAVASKPADYSDGSYDFHNSNGILGWMQAADRLSGRGVNRIAAGLGRAGEAASSIAGLPQGVTDWFHGQAVGDEAAAAQPVPGAVQWDDVKAHPGVGNVLSYIGQTGIGATPDLAAAGVAPWLYGASREGDVAHARAVNNGRQVASVGDVVAAAPVAAADTALMKYGLGGVFGGEGKGILASTLRAAGRDAVMGAGQPVMDYAGETLGTDNGRFDWNEAGDRALAGAVAMAPFGAAAHVAVRGARAIGAKDEAGPSPDVPQTVRQQLSPRAGGRAHAAWHRRGHA